MYAAAQGIYELSLNGRKVGDQELAPGWTDYARRIQSQTLRRHASAVGRAQNMLGAELATGWYAGQPGDVRSEQVRQ